jgi:hypothetical protein
MGLKFRRGSTAQQSGSLAFGEPYVNTTLGTLVVGGATGDIVLSTSGTGSTGNFGAISGSGLDITGNANIAGNVTVGGRLQIGDNTSDTLNVVSSLSSSLIPQTTDAFDLGSPTKIWRDLYISTGSIKMYDAAGNLISTLSATANGMRIAGELSASTINGLGSPSAFSASVDSKFNTLGSLSGSFARTNSANAFNGNQTITGSLIVTQDLTVLGSSSIQNISSSNLVIGAALVTLNTATPGARYAGLSIVDSGSVGGSGSFLYDAVQDEFIFVHRGNGTNITSSHFVLGPETYDNLGNETYLTNNRLPKGTGKEHLVDSNITDDGTLITLGSNTTITGTLVASGTTLVSSSAQVIGILSSLNTYTGSNDTTNTTQNSRLDQLSTASGSAITRLTALEVETSNLETFTASLSTTSNVRFGSLGIGMAASGTSGRIDAANDVVAFSTSDIRLKENIVPIENALDKISKISGNTYDWRVELKDVHGYEGNDVGVIAQEIEAVLPQLVQTRENGYKAVKYDKLVALLIEGIKDQQLQIEQLRIDLNNCRNKGL